MKIRHTGFNTVVFFLLCGLLVATACPASSAAERPRMGINFSGPSPGAAEGVFVDVTRICSQW